MRLSCEANQPRGCYAHHVDMPACSQLSSKLRWLAALAVTQANSHGAALRANAGELGSLGGSTHLHGFTCAAAVLRAVTPAAEDTAEAVQAADVQVSSGSSSPSANSSISSSMFEDSSSEAAGTGRLEPGEDRV